MAVTLDRRCFLRAGLTALALPRLPSLLRAASEPEVPRRLLIVGNHLGFRPDRFFPTQPGLEHDVPLTLEPLSERRGQFTLFSNLGHPDASGGHDGVYTLLSGIPKEHAFRYAEKNVSMDQVAARHAGASTRHRCLLTGLGAGTELSWDRNGTHVRPLGDPAGVFALLFEDPGRAATALRRSKMTRELSVLDGLVENTKAMHQRLGVEDRDTLDQYLTTLRDVEMELRRSRRWLGRPKPQTDHEPIAPEDRSQVEDLSLLMRLLVLALQTDSTRVATLEIPLSFAVHEIGATTSYHKISHHGQRPELLEQLQNIDSFLLKQFAGLLDTVEEARTEVGSSLLSHCAVVLAGGLGDANTHKNQDVPIVLAGGGLEHRGHVVGPREEGQREPLCNLWLSLLRWFGVPAEQFGTSTGEFSLMEIGG